MNNTRLASLLLVLGAAFALGACSKSEEAASTSAEPAAEVVTESDSVEVIPEETTESAEAPPAQ